MPELPEVETIRRGLKDFILHKKITKTTVFCEKSFLGTPELIVGHRVDAIRRFGKALVLDLSDGLSLMIHLRMTGQLIYDGKGSSQKRYAAGHPSENFVSHLPNRQTRVAIELSSGVLYFNDQRKFGFIKVLATPAVSDDPFIKKLAPEPWSMSATELYTKLQKHKNSLIKATILDQTIICGLGNIYADESLFAAGIHPERRSGSLSLAEAERLLIAAKDVMEKSIASGGSTMATYVRADGTRGDYLEQFAQVFRREGQPCPRCQGPVIKIKVAGRGTHLCPHCQKLQNTSTPKFSEPPFKTVSKPTGHLHASQGVKNA